MRYARQEDLLRLAVMMQGSAEGISISDIEQTFGVSRRTAERMRDAVLRAFPHHDAGEDARAAAEVVLRAEGVRPVQMQPPVPTRRVKIVQEEDFDLIEDSDETMMIAHEPPAIPMRPDATPGKHAGRHIGTTEITQGNIDHNHIYLRNFFEKFPADAVGGSNRASAARREIAVDWGGATVVMTDLDGAKKFFRKRAWIREFFDRYGVRAGDMVTVEELAPYSYRVALRRPG